MQPHRLAILGSTGSIGRQTLDVVRALPGRFRVVALAAGRNTTLLEEQIREFRPEMIWAEDATNHMALKAASGARTCRWTEMPDMASDPTVDIVVVSTVGSAGLESSLAALRAGKAVALANKEVLVMAGAIVVQAATEGGGELRPIDSEHAAIWQCLWGEDHDAIKRIILTASGGAFRDRPLADLARVTPEEALRHPTWDMGAKVTIDSATLMNKGFEVIEARWLFDVPVERVDVVMHRESMVHSLVEFIDGTFKAQLGPPDMRLPIACALSYPERVAFPAPPMDLSLLGELHFGRVDLARYPCLRLALEAARNAKTYPAVLAAADEVAVKLFSQRRIGFTEIPHVIEDTLNGHQPSADATLQAILDADAWARRYAEQLVETRIKAK